MNNRQVISVLVVLALVAVGVFVTYRNRAGRTQKDLSKEVGSRLLPNFPLNEVEAITVRTGQDEVNLVQVDKAWRVKERDNYPANYDYVKDLVTKAWESKIVEVTPVGKSQLGRLQLIDPASIKPDEKDKPDDKEVGTLVIFRRKGDQEMARLLLGKTIDGAASQDSPFGFNLAGSTGRFVLVGDKSDTAYKVKESFSSLNADVKGWLEKAFLQPTGGLKSLAVEVPGNPEQSWKVQREKEGADPVLADQKEGEEIDPEKVKQAGSAFSSAYFNDVAGATDQEKAGLDKPQRVATAAYFDGFTYTIKVGNKVKLEDESSDHYLGVEVAYAEPPAPVEPTGAAPVAPQPEPAPAGETEEQKKARESKNADAQKAYEDAKARFDEARKKFEEDKKKWEDNKKKNEERLTKEKGYEGRTYIVSKYTVDWFLKDRKSFMKEKPATPAAGTPAPAPGTATTPAVTPTPVTPPGGVPQAPPKRIEAVTPPVTVEIPPKKDAKAEAPKPGSPKPGAPKPGTPKPSAPKPEATKPNPPKSEASNANGGSAASPPPAAAPAELEPAGQ